MALLTLDMSPLGKRVNFTTLLGMTITLFLVLFQAPAAQASNEISIFLVSKNKNATVEDALLSVPIFGKILGDKLENQTLIIQQKKEENLIFFLGSAKAFPKTKTELSVVSANTEYRFNISSKAFKKRKADSDSAWKTINLIELYNNDEIKKLLEEAANLKEQLEQTNNEAIESQNKRTELEQNLADLQLQLKDAQQKQSQAQAELSEKTAQLDGSEGKIAKAYEDSSKRVLELENLSSALQTTVKYQNEEVQRLKAQIASMENGLASVSPKDVENKLHIEALEKELSLQTSRVQELEAQLSAENIGEASPASNVIKDLEENLAGKEKELNSLKKKIGLQDGQLAQLSNENTSIAAQLEEANKTISTLESASKKTPKSGNFKTEDELKAELAKVKKELARVKTQFMFGAGSPNNRDKAEKTTNEEKITQKDGEVVREASSPTKDAAPFQKFLIDGKKTTVLERMIWRVKKSHVGTISLHLESMDLLLTAGSKIRFFDGKGKQVSEAHVEPYYNTAFALSNDEKRVAFEEDGEIHVYQIDILLNKMNLLINNPLGLRTEPITCFGHTRQVMEMAFLQDGKHLVSASDDGTTRLFLIENDTCSEIKRYSLGIREALTNDGFAFSINEDKDSINGDKEWRLIRTNLFTGDQETIARQSGRYGAYPQSFRQADVMRHLPKSKKLVVFGSSIRVTGNYDNLANVWLIDTETGKTTFIQKKGSKVGSAIRTANKYDRTLAISSDERYAAYVSGYGNNTVYLYDLKERSQIHQFEGISKDLESINFISGSHGMIVHNNETADWGGALHYFSFD